jgi:hypothetical protein
MYSHTIVGTSNSQLEKAPHSETCMWNQAITEAKMRIKQLRYTIKVYQELRDAGEPWPGAGGMTADAEISADMPTS